MKRTRKKHNAVIKANGMPWSSSAYCQRAFAEPTCVTIWPNSAAACPKPSGRGP